MFGLVQVLVERDDVDRAEKEAESNDGGPANLLGIPIHIYVALPRT